MTTFGVEWETNLLIFFPENKIPLELSVKKPYDTGIPFTTLSLENYSPYRTPSDCLTNIEVQMGVFESKSEDVFEIKEFKKICNIFSTFWEGIINDKKIILNNGKFYDVLVYSEKNGKFQDCARLEKSQNNAGYTSDLSYDIKGVPQITFGIKLTYVISLFGYISELIVNKNFSIEPPMLTVIRGSYQTVGIYCDGKGIKNLDIVSFFILLYYYVYSSTLYKKLKLKVYHKASFVFKLRTNFRDIYTYIKEPEKELSEFINKMKEDDDLDKDIVSHLSDTFFKNKKFVPWYFDFDKELDFGEWDMGKNKNIHIELRNIPIIMGLVDDRPYIELKYINILDFCSFIPEIINKILNPSLQIDPKIILNDDE